MDESPFLCKRIGKRIDHPFPRGGPILLLCGFIRMPLSAIPRVCGYP